MANLSGRRPTGLGKKLLDGLAAVGTALSDGPKISRINEIDEQVRNLLQERDHLIVDLIDDYGLKPSDDYDPHWRKPESEAPVQTPGVGRLTTCKGYEYLHEKHEAHPACPYLDRKHGEHEFTLND